jgi:phage/plasmid-associated DNA primase
VVDFESLFTENPAVNDAAKPFQFKLDKNIKEKFEAWKGVFAAMLVARAFKTKGDVPDCAKVLSASNSYRERQDYFAEFVHDCITNTDPHGFVRKNELVLAFKEWYNTNHGFKSASPKDITGYMDKTFGVNKNGVWVGVKLQNAQAQEDECIALAGGARVMEDITFEEI